MFSKIKTQKNRTKTPNIEKSNLITVGNPFRTFRSKPIHQQQKIQPPGSHDQNFTAVKTLASFVKQKKSQLLVQEAFINYIKHKKRKKSSQIHYQQRHHHNKSRSSQSESKNIKVKNKRQLLQFIMKKPFFNQMSSKLVQQLCEKMQYLDVQSGQYIYKIGDFANRIYIMLDGKIDLMIPEEKQQDITTVEEKNQLQELILSRKFTYDQQLSISQKTSLQLFHNHSDKYHANQVMTQNQKKELLIKLKTIKTLNKWECFGQFQIDNPQKRTVSALAKTYSQLLVIKRQASQSSSTQQKFAFINSLGLFRKMFRPSLQNLIYHMDSVKLSYGQKVYLQGSEISNVYILVEGQLLLLKKIKMNFLQCHVNSRAESTWSKRYDQQQSSNNLKIDLPYEKYLPFLKLQKGQILNDADLILNNKIHGDTCIVNSEKAVFYTLPKQLFLDRIMSAENQVASIKQLCKQKIERKQQKIKNLIHKYFEDEMLINFLSKKSTRISGQNRKMMIKKHCKSMTIAHQHIEQPSNQQQKIGHRRAHTSFQMLKQKQQLRVSNPFNFFKQFNNTFKRSESSKRKIIHRTLSQSKKKPKNNLQLSDNQTENEESIPAAVKDIVKIVAFKQKYQKIRHISESKHSFKIDLSNVPLYVQKKYEGFFKMQKNKKN